MKMLRQSHIFLTLIIYFFLGCVQFPSCWPAGILFDSVSNSVQQPELHICLTFGPGNYIHIIHSPSPVNFCLPFHSSIRLIAFDIDCPTNKVLIGCRCIYCRIIGFYHRQQGNYPGKFYEATPDRILSSKGHYGHKQIRTQGSQLKAKITPQEIPVALIQFISNSLYPDLKYSTILSTNNAFSSASFHPSTPASGTIAPSGFTTNRIIIVRYIK